MSTRAKGRTVGLVENRRRARRGDSVDRLTEEGVLPKKRVKVAPGMHSVTTYIPETAWLALTIEAKRRKTTLQQLVCDVLSEHAASLDG